MPEVHVLHGDSVARFDEVSAAGGALGRFPGREVMGLVKDFISAVHRRG
jgi:2,3-bisphosphoglycerate-independent phosphoglycerate mutase